MNSLNNKLLETGKIFWECVIKYSHIFSDTLFGSLIY